MSRIYIYMTVLMLFFSAISCRETEKDDNITVNNRGKRIIEAGELAAVNTQNFSLARYGRNWYEMRVIGIAEHGTMVNAGDSILQFDPGEIHKYIIERETKLQNELAALQKTVIQHSNQIKEDESRIQNERISFDLKKIELEASRFESPRIRKIKELEFEQAKINLEKEEKKFLLSHIIREKNLRIQQIKVEQVQREMASAYETLPKLTIRTPISGVFQKGINEDTDELIKVGDIIYPGSSLGNVPDLDWMMVKTSIDENDFLKIYLGQPVGVRLDAMPELTFEGKISFIGKLCRPKEQESRQKVFEVEVKILTSDPRLKPGMTVSCEFL